MKDLKTLDDFLLENKGKFDLCQNKLKLKLTPVKKGNWVETSSIDGSITETFKAPEDGWQAEYRGVKAFFNQAVYEERKLETQNIKLFACVCLTEDVQNKNRVLAKGGYIVFEVDEETRALKNAKSFTEEQFKKRFNVLCMAELKRLSNRAVLKV